MSDHYVHVSDIPPTVYDLLGLDPAAVVKGIPQEPLDRVSFAAALRDPSARSSKHTQFYSMMGTRAIWHDGWFANTVHPPTSATPNHPGWSHFGEDRWELFHITADRSQIHDLAAAHPDKLDELKALWHAEALRYHGYPLNDLSVFELIARWAVDAAGAAPRAVFYPDTPAASTPLGGLIRGRSFTLRAPVSITDPDAEGVLFSQGSRSGGQVLYVIGGRLHYVCNFDGVEQTVASGEPITLGRCVFGVDFIRTGAGDGLFDIVGDVVLTADERTVGSLTGVRMAGFDPMQTVSAGRSVAYSVSGDYVSPNPFRGGGLEQVTIDFAGHGEQDPVADAVAQLGFAHD